MLRNFFSTTERTTTGADQRLVFSTADKDVHEGLVIMIISTMDRVRTGAVGGLQSVILSTMFWAPSMCEFWVSEPWTEPQRGTPEPAACGFQHHGQKPKWEHQGQLLIVFSTMDRYQSSSTTLRAFLLHPAILAAQPAQIGVHLTLMRPPRLVNLSGNMIKAVQQRLQILCLFTHTPTWQNGSVRLIFVLFCLHLNTSYATESASRSLHSVISFFNYLQRGFSPTTRLLKSQLHPPSPHTSLHSPKSDYYDSQHHHRCRRRTLIVLQRTTKQIPGPPPRL